MKQLVITGGKGTLGVAIAAAFESPGWKIAAPGLAELLPHTSGQIFHLDSRC